MSNFKLIGKIKDAHGLKGELYVLVFSGEVSWVKRLTQVQIGEQLYPVQRASAHRDGFILAVEGIENRNQSEALRGAPVSISESLMVSKKGETIYLAEILGFEVFDQAQLVGVIEGFSSNGPQDLLVVKGKETYEIPFVAAFIQEIQFDEKKVLMNLPPGLLELNGKDE